MNRVLSKKKIIDSLVAELPFIKKTYQVNKIGLFGSYARDEQKEISDVDLLVEFGTPISFFTLFNLEDYLSDKLGVKVEIITPGALKELTIPTIMRDVIYVE